MLFGFQGLSIISGQIITDISGSNILWSTWAEHAHLRGRRKNIVHADNGPLGCVKPFRSVPLTITGQEEKMI